MKENYERKLQKGGVQHKQTTGPLSTMCWVYVCFILKPLNRKKDMPLQSAAVQTFLDKLPDAYAFANKDDVFMDYKEVHLHAICECIKAFLIVYPKNWALARRSSHAAGHYANMYAAATELYFNDLNRMPDRAQVNERNILLHADAAARKEALKKDPAALAIT
jgi:hypothetical protein